MEKTKRIVAVICVVLLVGLYVATFILSLADSSATMTMFKGCVALTIFIPVAAYLYICLHRYAMNRSGRKDYYTSGVSRTSSSGGTSRSEDKQDVQQ
ncbi:MAG: hypothetical protein K6G58_07535 [Lachnospiraceae bacterium]|nr:hypothetical protein [Lachnospiraceae bacterium]